MLRHMVGAVAAAAALLALPGQGSGQVAEAVEELQRGTVRFGYAARPEVEICDQGIRMGDHRVWWRSGPGEGPAGCRRGWVEVDLKVRNGRVLEVEVVRGAEPRAADREVGEVTPDEAVAYLLGLAREAGAVTPTREAAKDAVFPALLADVDGTWRQLADLADDRSVDRGVRKSALFWLGQEAADAATEGLSEIAWDADEEQDIRDAAVFALAQRDSDESVPILMELALDAREAPTRRTALFWLAQTDDPRVVSFFEEILLRRVR